jgi:hypothetical protein
MMDLSDVEEVAKRLKKLVEQLADREDGDEPPKKVGLDLREDE